MAVDKLVDSTELDNGLTTIADAIRTKGGTSAPLAFPDGMAQAIADIPTGITPTGNINITDTNVTDVTNYATAQVVDADLVASNIKKNVNILGVVGSFEGGGEVDDTFLAKSIEQMLSGKGFSKIEFTNVSINSNITLSHGLGYAPQTFIMVPKSTANLASNRYYAGICTNPSDQGSTTNNTALVRITGIAEHDAAGGITADNNFETVVGKQFFDLPYIYLIGLFTFIVSSTNNNFVIRNGNQVPTGAAAGNALGSGDFVIFFK